MTQQQLELARVHANIHEMVLAYVRQRVGREFVGSDLARHVFNATQGMTAPDSAGRILRDLRQAGVIDYEVVDRRRSRYKVVRA